MLYYRLRLRYIKEQKIIVVVVKYFELFFYIKKIIELSI
jgi:hypothetical protein